MSVYLHLKDICKLGCRIMFSISNFNTISNILNRQDRKTNLINLIKQTFLYILYAFAFGMSLFSAYILLTLGCVLNDSCYYFYGGI